MLKSCRNLFCTAAAGTARSMRVSDFKREDQEGNMVTTVMKIDHPHRVQRVMLVPVPFISSDQYLRDWVYQPYVKDHLVVLVNGIYHPFPTFIPQMLKAQKLMGAEDYDFFRLLDMPDSVDCDLTRTEHYQRQKGIFEPLYTFWYTQIHLPSKFRLKREKWVSNGMQKIVGARYLHHPPDAERSYVVFVPVEQAHAIVNSLTELGFTVNESLAVEYGKKETIEKVEKMGYIGEMFPVGYLWVLWVLALSGAYKLGYQEYYTWVLEEFEKCDADPNDHGYNYTAEDKETFRRKKSEEEENKPGSEKRW